LKEKAEEEYWEELKVNKNWRNQCNEGLIQLFGDLGVLSFVGICRLEWSCQQNEW
jgi:hypothetical protein